MTHHCHLAQSYVMDPKDQSLSSLDTVVGTNPKQWIPSTHHCHHL